MLFAGHVFWLSTITEVVCTHVRCQAKADINRLARYSLNIGDQSEWLDCPPSFIIDLLTEDL